ncbi:RTA1 like protein-domain-containing protein [Usnea florida]
MAGCPAQTDPKSQWPEFCPNIGAAYLFAILFGLTLVVHIVQSIVYRKGYSWVIAMGALWQTACYAFRVLSIKYVTNETYYAIWFILMLLAPLWINAYVYMVLGRMVYNFTASATILGFKAWRFGLYFVLLDIFAFIVQAVGASTAVGNNIPQSQIFRGLHIYMSGVGLQQFFICCFIGLAIRFQHQMKQDTPVTDLNRALRLLYILYAVLTLITVRIIFRIAEYSRGYTSGIPVHEAYQYILDSTLMLIASVLFNIVHPGQVMPGKESDLPSRKQRKAIGKSNVRGRMAGILPLSEPSHVPSAEPVASEKPTYPKFDDTTLTHGYTSDIES